MDGKMQIKLRRLVCIGFVLFLFLISTGVSSADVVITRIDNKSISENEHLTFDVIVRDTEDINATITIKVENLPEGATFNPSTQDPNTYTFSWIPGPGTAGIYRVTFKATVTDGDDFVDEPVTIIVQGVDKNNLLFEIEAANQKIENAVVGTDIGQYPQAAMTSFQTAINKAQEVANNPRATQAQVNDEVNALKEAEGVFDAARITSIDKSSLISAIAAANSKIATASPGNDIGQYPQSAIDAFRAAIAGAQAVVDNPNATNAEVNQAVTNLKAAEAVFDAARQVPPSSVTDLRDSGAGTSWIYWTWTNPSDPDFSHVMIYIDGIFVTNTSDNYYNVTGLDEGTVHTIGIQSVDTSGIRNPEIVTDRASTIIIDRTPPESVKDIHETDAGPTWLHWTWTNPSDPDFSNVRIYIDGIFVTTTSNNYYNATGLSSGVEYTISVETVDTSGNINTDRVSDSAITLKLPVISKVVGKDIRSNSITLEWYASEDTAMVQISQNGLILANVTESTYTHRDLNSNTTYNYILTPYSNNGLQGEAVSISLTTSSTSSSGSSSRRSSSSGGSSSGSSGGGGGSAGSVEDFENVALKDVATKYLTMNTNVTYEFTREGNPVRKLSFYSLKNSGDITSTIEVLNNRSRLVNSNPEGIIYKYVNIWVGKAGFATSNNIRDARVEFRVENSWIEEMGISTEDIKLQRFNGTAWEVLPTTSVSKSNDYTTFEARTPGFSPFAITAGKILSSVNDADMNTSHIEDIGQELTKKDKSRVWTYIMAFLLIGILAVGYEYLKRQKIK
ncbi:MAG: PGF-pre-PGF domain-containing protein [Methanomethylovorans sp.]|nr:PGF-pre-PGF domain-containing protein [Methanomethylovorans sp.]